MLIHALFKRLGRSVVIIRKAAAALRQVCERFLRDLLRKNVCVKINYHNDFQFNGFCFFCQAVYKKSAETRFPVFLFFFFRIRLRPGALDDDFRKRMIGKIRFVGSDGIHNIHALHHLAECRILSVKMRRIGVHDEKL